MNVNRPDITSAAYKLIYDHRAGFTQFSDNVMIVVAGNPPETSSVANSLPAPLISRMIILDITPPSIKEWGAWMHETYDANWDPMTLAFLMRFQSDNIFLRCPKETETLKAYPTPRTWSSVAVLAKLGFADDEVIEGLLGGEVGAKFAAFKKNNVNIEDLIAAPEGFEKLSVDCKYMASLMLASWFVEAIPERMTEKNKVAVSKKIEPAIKLVDAMSKVSREFVLLSFISMPQSKGYSLVMALVEYDKKFYKMLQDITMNLMKDVKVN